LYHGILKADVSGVLPFDEHIGEADGVGFGVYFLTEKAHVNVGIKAVEKIIGGGEHTAGSAVLHGGDFAFGQEIVAAFGKDDVHHEPYHFPWRVMIACLRIGRKPPDQVFKHIAHDMTADRFGVKVEFAEFFLPLRKGGCSCPSFRFLC
jgi:hypothetical protein